MKTRGPGGYFIRTAPLPLCIMCNAPVNFANCKCCSRACSAANRIGKRMGNYKGARTVLNGYVWIRPDASTRKPIQEHRWVMEQFLGRKLNSKEVVHHKNGVRNDNSLQNLEIIPNQSTHMRTHHHMPNAKLTNDDVRELLRLYRTGITRAALSQQFGICKVQVGRIVNNKTKREL